MTNRRSLLKVPKFRVQTEEETTEAFNFVWPLFLWHLPIRLFKKPVFKQLNNITILFALLEHKLGTPVRLSRTFLLSPVHKYTFSSIVVKKDSTLLKNKLTSLLLLSNNNLNQLEDELRRQLFGRSKKGTPLL